MHIRNWLVPTVILTAAAGLLAFGGPGGGPGGPDGPPPRGCPRDSTHHRAPPKLTTEQKAFLEAERTLRDSMEQAIRSYGESVRKGSDARAMVSDRAIINDYARRLERLRQDNMDVWLDVLAVRPHMGPRHHRGGKRPGDCDSLRPPPPEDDSTRNNP